MADNVWYAEYRGFNGKPRGCKIHGDKPGAKQVVGSTREYTNVRKLDKDDLGKSVRDLESKYLGKPLVTESDSGDKAGTP